MRTPEDKDEGSCVKSCSDTSGINIVLDNASSFKNLKNNEFLNKLDEEIRKTEINVK